MPIASTDIVISWRSSCWHCTDVTLLVSVVEDIPEWERELQAELQEYEVVTDGQDDLDDADLEQEILQQIEAEAKQ